MTEPISTGIFPVPAVTVRLAYAEVAALPAVGATFKKPIATVESHRKHQELGKL